MATKTPVQIPATKLVFNVPNATWIKTKYDWRKINKAGELVTHRSYTTEAARRHEETIEGNVEVIIDIPEILKQISVQALTTKGGKSKLLSGLVTARVIKRTSKGKVTTEIPVTAGYVEVQK